MSAQTVDQQLASIEHHGLGRFAAGFNDMLTMAQRNLIALVRVPQLHVFSTIQPMSCCCSATCSGARSRGRSLPECPTSST
jgi:hypothetical protein